MNRRGLMIANALQGGGDNYVHDGLILFLDGLNQGSEAGKWIDVVGNKEFTLTNATKNTDNVSFASGYAQCSTGLEYQTFEIVCNITSTANYATLWTANSNKNCNIFKNTSTLGFGGNSSSPSIPLTRNSIYQYSALFETSYSDIKRNDVTQTTGTSTNWGSTPSGLNIGYYGGQYSLSAVVYAVRLYNRKLTDAERTQNFNEDVRRFGIS